MTTRTERARNAVGTVNDEGLRDDPLQLSGVSYRYGNDASDSAPGIENVDLTCDPGSWTAVMGPSGAGKSTLLYCASGLLPVAQGSVRVAGRDLTTMGEGELTRLRRDHIGFVFQDYNLVEAFTCLQNVMLSDLFGGRRIESGTAEQALAAVGLQGCAERYPSELSGGQRQRVAIARALALQPAIVFADEPTGALDSRSAALVLDAFERMVEQGRTVLMVTHDPNVAARAQRTVFLLDGHVESVRSGASAQELSDHLVQMAQQVHAQERTGGAGRGHAQGVQPRAVTQ